MNTEHDSGSLSSQGRFQRMEESLIRIEMKLDDKLDKAEVTILTDEVESLKQWKYRASGIAAAGVFFIVLMQAWLLVRPYVAGFGI